MINPRWSIIDSYTSIRRITQPGEHHFEAHKREGRREKRSRALELEDKKEGTPPVDRQEAEAHSLARSLNSDLAAVVAEGGLEGVWTSERKETETDINGAST